MALSNAERQRKHREDHIGKHRDAQRVANLLKRKHLTGPEDAGRQPAKAGGGCRASPMPRFFLQDRG